MSAASDARFMALALSLGRRGMGRVWPNPAVGCVIVKDGQIVGRGHTADGGRPHAETEALAQAGDASHGATAYVTLEPCAHDGETPPCAHALVTAGIERVVVATVDPDERVSGKGIAMLRDAGLAVEVGLMEHAARDDHAGFLQRVTMGRPFVTLKLAGTLDGRIATATGESRWITGPEARRVVHMMRARHDAVMVGAGTARADDPLLMSQGLGVEKQPVRVVVSRKLNLSLDSKLAQSIPQAPLWLCHGFTADAKAWVAKGAVSLPCGVKSNQVDPKAVMAQLADAGITRVFCEGGGMLAASLLTAGVVDRLVVFNAGVTVGAEGTPSLAAMGIDRLMRAPRFQLTDVRSVGGDIMHSWARIA